MKTPLVVLNLKTYKEGTSKNAISIAKACKEVSIEYDIEIAIAPQFCDIYRITTEIDIPIFSQHIDAVGSGSFTGHVFPECVKDAGAIGTLINHSERRLTLADIEASIRICKELDLVSIICTNNIATTEAAAVLMPDFVAVEPPELIGSGIPVSKADPEVVSVSVKKVKNINPAVKVLCGAGISKGEDMKAALELGAEGVLLASGIVKAKDPKDALKNLVSLI